MPFEPSFECLPLVAEAQELLGMSQGELADALASSRRTITRWFAREALPSVSQLHQLARAVHPKDERLAARLAAEGGTTLTALGLVRPEPPAPPPPPPPDEPPAPPPRPFPPAHLMVESIVCAAAETMQSPPAAVRDVLRAAFARARGLGLSVEEVDDALSPRPSVTPQSRAAVAVAGEKPRAVRRVRA